MIIGRKKKTRFTSLKGNVLYTNGAHSLSESQLENLFSDISQVAPRRIKTVQ